MDRRRTIVFVSLSAVYCVSMLAGALIVRLLGLTGWTGTWVLIAVSVTTATIGGFGLAPLIVKWGTRQPKPPPRCECDSCRRGR